MSPAPRLALGLAGALLLAAAPARASEPAAASTPADAVDEPFIPERGAPGRRVHLTLRSTFLYSTFSPALGGSLRLAAATRLWDTRRASGTFDGGLVLAYSRGGPALYPWIRADPDVRQVGSDQGVMLALSVGHTFHFGRRRRAALGVHLLAGVHVLHQRWRLEWLREGLSGQGRATHTEFTFGPEVDFHVRLSRRVGLNLVLGGVCTCLPSTAGSYVRAGAGLTFYLR